MVVKKKAKKKAQEPTIKEVIIRRLRKAHLELCIIGQQHSPMVMNSLGFKAKCDLIFPPNASEKRARRKERLKHVPLEEFRESMHVQYGNRVPTRCIFPATALKKSMCTATIDSGNATAASIKRLVTIHDYSIPIWGIPKIWTTMVRMADRERTPDMRTRALFPEWATKIHVSYVTPNLTEDAILNLIYAAGEIVGFGDARVEKGAFSFGMFRIVNEKDKDFQRIIKIGGRAAQDKAIKDPEYYDVETERLLKWFDEEIVRRERAAEARAREKAERKNSKGTDQEEDVDDEMATADE